MRASRVAADLNGGAAIAHAPAILRALGCDLAVLGGTPGLFSRSIDPTNDPLELLTRTVREKVCDVGFAFDCDGDRLVLVDGGGKKRSGDYMLTLAIKEMLPGLRDRSVVVSADTTQAIDDVVSELGGRILQVQGRRGERDIEDDGGAHRNRRGREQRRANRQEVQLLQGFHARRNHDSEGNQEEGSQGLGRGSLISPGEAEGST